MLSSQIDTINDDIKPVIETIMDKGTVMGGTYEKAMVLKHVVKYGLLCMVQHFAKIRPDRPLKEGTV